MLVQLLIEKFERLSTGFWRVEGFVERERQPWLIGCGGEEEGESVSVKVTLNP